MQCNIDGCSAKYYAKGFCQKHYMAAKCFRKEKCSLEGCGRGLYAKGLCNLHYQRLLHHGNPLMVWGERTGLSETTTGVGWRSMLGRCENPLHDAYPYYGGKGIRVCDRWHMLELFVEDMGLKPPHSHLHRKDSKGDYCKENCVWMDSTQHHMHHVPKGKPFYSKGEKR